MVSQGLYKNGLHPICYLVQNLFKLNVRDLLYVNLIAGFLLGPLLYILYSSPVAASKAAFQRIFGGGVPPGSPNPDPISDQKTLFSRPVFRPGVLNPYRLSNLV